MNKSAIPALIFVIAILFFSKAGAQELFVATEPASNMAKNSIRLRLSNEAVLETDFKSRTSLGIMYGLNKSLTLNVNAFMADFYQRKQRINGYSFYGKYRFLNSDNVQKHFRGAVFAQYSTVKFPIIHDEINLAGENNGLQGGIVFTQLLHKLALSGSVSYTQSLDKFIPGHEMLHDNAHNSIAYTLSSGYLIFPREYTDYKQINTNVYLEFLGDSHTGSGRNFMDASPAIQFIFNSKIRLDFSKRVQLWGNMERRFKNLYQVRVEYNLFNVF
ncbi:MAG: hypothetical protein V4721_17620 [Bacteroidota bacterium]